MSAKASLVPEATVRSAESADAAVVWLKRFFFEDPKKAKQKGHRGGAVYLLDKKISLIRSGALETRGLSRAATIVPCIISFDNLGESGVLYKWLEEEALAKGLLFTHGGVRPITILTPEDYEALLAFRARGRSICKLLMEKTEARLKYGPLDVFLFNQVKHPGDLRVPSMHAAYETVVKNVETRMDRAVEELRAERTTSETS